MTYELFLAICLAAVASGTSILLPALGEMLTERSGVQNLGVEGMMLAGALFGYIVDIQTGSLPLGLLAAIIAATLLAAVHALLAVSLRANQIVSGLAVTLFGSGLTAFVGKPFVGAQAPAVLTRLPIPGLSQIPFVGPLLFMVLLARSRWGYELRVVGENVAAARYAGVDVRRTVLTAMLVSGGMAGIAGMLQVSGVVHLLSGQISNGYGYTAIIIAWLARLQPLAILLVAVLFGALVNGGFAVSQVGIPQALGQVVQGTILFFVLGVGDLFTRYRLRLVSAPRRSAAAPAPADVMTST